MTQATVTVHNSSSLSRPTLPKVSPREVLPFIMFAGLILLLAMYFVGAEQGAASLFGGKAVHEFTHDGRHITGFPCH